VTSIVETLRAFLARAGMTQTRLAYLLEPDQPSFKNTLSRWLSDDTTRGHEPHHPNTLRLALVELTRHEEGAPWLDRLIGTARLALESECSTDAVAMLLRSGRGPAGLEGSRQLLTVAEEIRCRRTADILWRERAEQIGAAEDGYDLDAPYDAEIRAALTEMDAMFWVATEGHELHDLIAFLGDRRRYTERLPVLRVLGSEMRRQDAEPEDMDLLLPAVPARDYRVTLVEAGRDYGRGGGVGIVGQEYPMVMAIEAETDDLALAHALRGHFEDIRNYRAGD
jgi:hypothetical protein